ncbi:Aste57867_9053 [Aphanomyces stellatus]|uniref:Aste57867_9053 protein n=1 Tax=Aphanomyces stellatus TaxID=120398 RepID=A0A485KM93_9STRA|nr:hypothetical protein As57867_009017 [Aphanomyces stellatus]VFT85937.1 Aste57867_9053 [Aphanomyces stellatus]
MQHALSVSCPVAGNQWIVRKCPRDGRALHLAIRALGINSSTVDPLSWLGDRVIAATVTCDLHLRSLTMGRKCTQMHRQRRQASTRQALARLLHAVMHVRRVAWECRDLPFFNALFTILNRFVAISSTRRRPPRFDPTSLMDFTLLVPLSTRRSPPIFSPTLFSCTYTDVGGARRSIHKSYDEFLEIHAMLVHVGQQATEYAELGHLHWLVRGMPQLPLAMPSNAADLMQRLTTFIGHVRWICHRHTAASVSNPTLALAMSDVAHLLDAFLAAPLPRPSSPPPRPPTLSAEDATKDIDCAICWGDFASDGSVRTLVCGHRFHGACMDTWLQQRPICPLCCRSIPSTGAPCGGRKIVFVPMAQRQREFGESCVFICIATVGAFLVAAMLDGVVACL